MSDREKLTDAMNDVKAVEIFLRKQGESWYADILSDACDTLSLLREQESQIAKWLWDRPHHFKCSNCGWFAGVSILMYLFCPGCGKRIEISVGELMKEWPNSRILEEVNKNGSC